jgi:hypothetical protein
MQGSPESREQPLGDITSPSNDDGHLIIAPEPHCSKPSDVDISDRIAESEGESSEDEECTALEEGDYGTETWAEYRQEGAKCVANCASCYLQFS